MESKLIFEKHHSTYSHTALWHLYPYCCWHIEMLPQEKHCLLGTAKIVNVSIPPNNNCGLLKDL